MARIAKLVAALLSVQLLVAVSWIGSAQASCNFAASCAAEELSGTTLSASCATVSGSSNPTSLDLNQNIANSNGQLLCNQGGGDFGASCSNLGLSGGHTLTANCKNTAGSLIQTSVDLDNCISNNDGTLSWC